jgi:hypothetical protein
MLGYVAKNATQTTCGFDKNIYAGITQQTYALDHTMCGNGLTVGTLVPLVNNPLDTSISTDVAGAPDATFVKNWVSHIIATFGTANTTGVKFYTLDNEPGLWHTTHRDVHPTPLTYAESYARGSVYAAGVKSIDPNALILGPSQFGWSHFFYSSYVTWAQATSDPDRVAAGGLDFIPWYLQKMKAYETANAKRILDYLDVHYYPDTTIPIALKVAGAANVQAQRIRATRSLWDPTYVDESWVATAGPNGGIIKLIPMLQGWIDTYYPGTKISISEYNFGGHESINGAIVQADVLGIFGQNGVGLASLFITPSSSNTALQYNVFSTTPGGYAFRMFLNYNGTKGRFGDQSVTATSANRDQLAIYAAKRTSDNKTTLMVINKTAAAIMGNIAVTGSINSTSAQMYHYSEANLNAIIKDADQPINSGNLSPVFWANSISIIIF